MPKEIDRRDLMRAAGWPAGALLVSSSQGQETPAGIGLPGDIRMGIIGLKGHYSEVLNAAKVVPQLKIAALFIDSPAEEEAYRLEPRLARARVYRSYEKMLDRESLDAVAVCGENGSRAQQVIACLDRGLPTAAEKPLALSLEELEGVKGALRKKPAPLTMLLPLRFDPPYLGMKQMIEQGVIGEPVALTGQKSYKLGVRPPWMKERRRYGGTIPWIAIHVIDLLRFVSGLEMVAVAAYESNVSFPQAGEMENHAGALYRLSNGGHATIRLDYLRPESAPSHGDDRLRVAGTKGVIEYQQGVVTLATTERPPHQVDDLPAGRPLIADFLDSVFNGAAAGLPLEDVLRDTEITLRTEEAAQEGRWVELV